MQPKQPKPFKVVFYEKRRGDRPAEEYMRSLLEAERAQLLGVIDHLAEMRGKPEAVNIAKVAKGVWRLAKGPHRIMYAIVSERLVILSAFLKKSQRIREGDAQEALNHLKDYLMREKHKRK